MAGILLATFESIETIFSCITQIKQVAQPIIPADRQKLRFCRPRNSNVRFINAQTTADRLLLVFIPAVLSVGHLLLCIYAAVTPSEGWGWVIVATVDFPFSILVAAILHALPPLLSFGLFGTLWWYLLGWLGAKLLVKLFNSASMLEGY